MEISRGRSSAAGRQAEAERPRPLKRAATGSELDAPEGGVGLEQLEADVPSFVATPNHLGIGFAAALGMNQTDALVEAKIAGDHGHAAGMADVHGDGVGAPGRAVFLPFDLEFYAGEDTLVSAKLSPAILQRCELSVGGHDHLAV